MDDRDVIEKIADAIISAVRFVVVAILFWFFVLGGPLPGLVEW